MNEEIEQTLQVKGFEVSEDLPLGLPGGIQDRGSIASDTSLDRSYSNEFDSRNSSSVTTQSLSSVEETLTRVTSNSSADTTEVNPFLDSSLPPPSDCYQFYPPSTYKPIRPRRKRGRPSLRVVSEREQYSTPILPQNVKQGSYDLSDGNRGGTRNFSSRSHKRFFSRSQLKRTSFSTSLDSPADSSEAASSLFGEELYQFSETLDQNNCSDQETLGRSDMVGKGAEKSKGDRKKLLDMMSLQFNTSDVADCGGEAELGRGKKASRGVPRTPKRKRESTLESSTMKADSLGGETSLASLNPITHALKKVRKERTPEDSTASPPLSRTTRKKTDLRRSGSEEEDDHPSDQLSPRRRKIGRPRKPFPSIDATHSPLHGYSLDGGGGTRKTKRSNRGGSRKGRAKGGSVSSAIGRESPHSESSLDSLSSKKLLPPKQLGMDDYPSDGELPATGRGRGRSRVSRLKGSAGRRGRGKRPSDRSTNRRSLTPVTSEADDFTVEDAPPIKRGIGRSLKKAPTDEAFIANTPTSMVSVDSPVGSAGEQSTGSSKAGKKKRKKYFKGLRYSFGKKRKKPKGKALGAHSLLDNSQETESLISEDVDADSLDSSSQDLSRRLLLLPGELDPYDPSAEFDDSHSEKSAPPLSLQQQRRAYQRKGKEASPEVMQPADQEEDPEEMEEDEEEGTDWGLYSQENEEKNDEEFEEEEGLPISDNVVEDEDVVIPEDNDEIVQDEEDDANEDYDNVEGNDDDENDENYEVEEEDQEEVAQDLLYEEHYEEAIQEEINDDYNPQEDITEDDIQEFEENESYTEEQEQGYLDHEEDGEDHLETGEEEEDQVENVEEEGEIEGPEYANDEEGDEEVEDVDHDDHLYNPDDDIDNEEEQEQAEEENEQDNSDGEMEHDVGREYEQEDEHVEMDSVIEMEEGNGDAEDNMDQGEVDELMETDDRESDQCQPLNEEGIEDTRNGHLSDLEEARNGHLSDLEEARNGQLSDLEEARNGQLSDLEEARNGQLSDLEEARNGQLSDLEEARNGQLSDLEEARNGQLSDLEEASNGPLSELEEARNGQLSDSDVARNGQLSELEEEPFPQGKQESDREQQDKDEKGLDDIKEDQKETLTNNKEEDPCIDSKPPCRVNGDGLGGIKKRTSLCSSFAETRQISSMKRGLEESHKEANTDKGDDGVRKSKRLNRLGANHPLAIAAPTGEDMNEMGVKAKDLGFDVADPTLANVLCKCRAKENPRAVNLSGENYCQAMDSFDGRIIGCCNTVSNHRYLRVSGKIPFMLMCTIHRQRIRKHNCCPGCGLFCTQGIFLECRWDRLGSRHYFHKLCGLVISGISLCPHCGTDQPPVEVHLELKLSRKPIVYLKQHQEKKGFNSSARMSLSKVLMVETDATPKTELTDDDVSLDLGNGKIITPAKLPVGLDQERLKAAITAIKLGKVMNVKPAPKGIYWACKHGDLEKLLYVLVNGVSPNAKVREYGNQCGLHTASTHGCLPAIHILVTAGAALDFTDSQLQTPLMIAIMKSHNDIVSYLIHAGVNLNAKTQDGMTCLHLAAKSGNYVACKYILDSGRLSRHAINIQDEGGWTPLVWASENRCINVVKILLDRGANPQICDVEQNTALHWAAFSGSTHICSMVLDRGCSLRSMNGIGDTPLHIAARQNHVEAVVLLLARGASLDIRNSRDQTPLDCAFPDSDVFLQLTLNKKLKTAMVENGFKNERILSSDIAAGKESVPIPVMNGEDEDGLPKDYIYVAENCEALNVNIDRTMSSLKCCDCEDGCNSENCICSQLNFQCWYDPEGRLLSDFNYADPPMIFECNRACGCNKLSCHNRVVQHGMTSHLQLFKTRGKGWGVRALKDIEKGSYVCEYVGEIITDLEADLREDDSYLFDLDNRDSETFCIDARQYGNVARFINHMCEANLTPVKVFIDHQDLVFPRIAFFANRTIEADEELGFDYGEKFWIIKYKHFTCMCGSSKCKYSSETIQTTLENYNKKIKEHQQENFVESGTKSLGC